MNRKDRRAAQKGKRASPLPPSSGFPSATLGTNLFQSAVAHLRAGRIDQAERACRDLLMIEPGHADGLHLLGMIAFQGGHHDAARELIGRSLAADGRNPDCHFNMAQVLRALGRPDEAMAHLGHVIALKRDHVGARLNLADVLTTLGRLGEAAEALEQALAIDPRLVQAHYGLATLAMQQGRLDEAVTRYGRVLAERPDYPEAHNNLGIALAALGQWDAAAAHYRRALALNPDLVDVYRNLGRILLAQGDTAGALALAQRALSIGETDEVRTFFVQCVRTLAPTDADEVLRSLVARALAQGWGRPSDLAGLAAGVFKLGAAGTALRARTGAAFPHALLATLAADPLLHALLVSAPIFDLDLERLMTTLRANLLDRALGSDHEADAAALALFCRVARQCFINEYVYACTAEETVKVRRLREQVVAAIETRASVPPLWLAATAAYEPLHSLAHSESLLAQSWPEPIAALIGQQVREPQQERGLRRSIPLLTTVDDEVSLRVQRQYEDMPYPRWITASPPGRPVNLDWYLRNQFPLAPIRDGGPRSPLDILVAGCGTGQHAIETARRFANARVLAIDLSLSSLSYAARKTRALGLNNIDYAQADILKLGSLGRSFDLIEPSGVLHHLADPARGWRILLTLLRPAGFMHVGLYSAFARADVRAVRDFIAERGYGSTAAEIRRCRQELLASPENSPLRNVARFPDFFTTSECRDLLFHVQEHQLTIPDIKAFLDSHGLTFIGFSGAPVLDYRRRFPEDAAAIDLNRWHAFETENPSAFAGMYQFWVQKG